MMALFAPQHARPWRWLCHRGLVVWLMVASVIVTSVLVTLGGGAAHADPRADEMAKAQALFDEGIHLFNMGRFEEACPKFEASLALIAGIGTRGKLAECYEKIGRTASAWRLYREVERLAERTNDDLRRRVAQKRARALEPRLARLTIVPGPSVTLPGFQVRSNNRVIEPRVFGSERIVDPGTYIIIASAPGHQPWTVTEHVDEGQRATIEVRALVPADQPEAGVRGQRVAAYSLIGVGLAGAVGGGAYFGMRASSQWDDAFDKNHCDPDTLECNPMGKELADAANRSANLANLSVAVGLATVTAGVVLWLRARPDEPAPDSPAVSLTPALSGDSLGLVLSSPF